MLFQSRVLLPLIDAAEVAVPVVLLAALAHELVVSVRARRGGTSRVEAQRRRDSRLMLAGAMTGGALGFWPVMAFASGRLGMLVVLPTVGAAAGLTLSGLLPPVEPATQRVAALGQRSAGAYLSSTAARALWGACAGTVLIAAWRLILPADAPWPESLAGRFGRPVLAPTRSLYVVVALAAVASTAVAWAAAGAVARRARPAADADALAQQDDARRQTVRRLVGWSTASLLLLNAALLTPLPAKMGGVVFGDVQLIQRATDVLTVALIGAAFVVAARARLQVAE